MRYILTSNIDQSLWGALTPDEQQAANQRFIDFTQALAESGVMRGAEHLQPADTATTVRVRNGDLLLTDGPYADVTERFGGFWIVETDDLDTALKHAQDCPASTYGSVEVRGIVEYG